MSAAEPVIDHARERVEVITGIRRVMVPLFDRCIGRRQTAEPLAGVEQCRIRLAGEGAQRPRDLKSAAIPKAANILQDNVYGWFARAERGLYVLTDTGRAALERWPQPPPGGDSA